MAWQNFQFGTLHVGRDDSTGTWSVVDSAGTAITTGSASDGILAGVMANAYDSRAGSAMEWLAANRLRIDRSASPGSTPDALFIPSGHNCTRFQVYSRATSGGAATERGDSGTITLGDPTLVSLSAIERYLDIAGTTADSNVRIGEAVFTDIATPTIGPEPGWRDDLSLVVLRTTLESGGSAVLQKGTSQRVLELVYPHVTTADDVTIFGNVETTAGKPFVVVPAYDDVEEARWVFLDGDPERDEQGLVPAGQTTLVPRYRFRLREQTL